VSEPLKSALIRALIAGLVLAGSAFFSALAGDQAAGQHLGQAQLESAGIAAGVVFFATIAIRGGIEGAIDHQAAANGGRRASDPPPAPPAPPAS
jgi:hypothetical protein